MEDVGYAPVRLRKGLGSRTAVIHHPVVKAKPAAPECGPRRQARCIRHIRIVKPAAFGRDAIYRGTGVPVVPVAAQVVRAQAVDIEVEDAHLDLFSQGPC